jgi:hypothetical protein
MDGKTHVGTGTGLNPPQLTWTHEFGIGAKDIALSGMFGCLSSRITHV